jgi:hypothetical protein
MCEVLIRIKYMLTQSSDQDIFESLFWQKKYFFNNYNREIKGISSPGNYWLRPSHAMQSYRILTCAKETTVACIYLLMITSTFNFTDPSVKPFSNHFGPKVNIPNKKSSLNR